MPDHDVIVVGAGNAAFCAALAAQEKGAKVLMLEAAPEDESGGNSRFTAGSGEAVMLFVVKRDPALTKEALAAWCATQFTGYKRPKYIEFRDKLPKTNVGKILRRELRDGVLKKAA